MAAKARFIKMLIKSGAVESRNGKLVTIDKAKADKVKAQYEAIIARTKAKPKTATYKPKGWADNKMQTKAKGTTYKPKGWAANQMTTKAKPTTAPKAKTPTKAKPTPMPKSIVDPVGLYPSNYPQKMKEYEGIITKYENAVKGGLSPAVEKKAKDKISKYKDLLKYQKSDKSRIKKAYVLLEIEKAKTKTPTTAPKKRAATATKAKPTTAPKSKKLTVADYKISKIKKGQYDPSFAKKLKVGDYEVESPERVFAATYPTMAKAKEAVENAVFKRNNGVRAFNAMKTKPTVEKKNVSNLADKKAFYKEYERDLKSILSLKIGGDQRGINNNVQKIEDRGSKEALEKFGIQERKNFDKWYKGLFMRLIEEKAKPTTAPKKRAATVKKKIASKPIVKTTKAKALENIYSKDKIFKGKNFYFNNGRIFDLESIGGDLMIDQDNTAYYLKYPVKYYALNANKVSEKDFMILDDYKTKLDKSPKTSMYNYVLTELSKKHKLNVTALMKMTANRPNFNNNKADFDSKIQKLVSRVGVKLTVAEKKKAYELYIIEKFKTKDLEYFQSEFEVIKRVLDYSKTATKAKPTTAPKKKSITPKIGSFGSFWIMSYKNGERVYSKERKKIRGITKIYGYEVLIISKRVGISNLYQGHLDGYEIGIPKNNFTIEELKNNYKNFETKSNSMMGAASGKKYFDDHFEKFKIIVSENLK
jgi:hypothetical protein